MADNPKAAWPKTPDGTTDWQYVFEDPDTGFIPLVSKAQSTDALKLIATVILEKLFTRKNDVDELNLHLARLASIIRTGGGVEPLIAQVNALLREVKDERIEKARVYVERKRAGAAIDRRAGLLWKIDKFLEPRILIPLGMVLVLALSGLVYMALQSALGPDTNMADIATAEQAAKAAADAKRAMDEERLQSLEAIRPKPEAKPVPILFQSVRWPLATKYTTDRPQYYSVVLYVSNWEQKVEICQRLPTIMDRFYTSFNDVMPQNRPAREAEMSALEQEIAGAVNAALPDNYVKSAAVARYGTRDFRVATRPPYCSTPNN